jgi:hypothetical protein
MIKKWKERRKTKKETKLKALFWGLGFVDNKGRWRRREYENH